MDNLEEYMQVYGRNYSDEARNAIYELYDTDTPVDIILQIKSRLNKLPKENVYDSFINKLDEYDMLKGRVLEVSCGFYPALAWRIVKTHDVELTSIDPRLVTLKSEGVHLIKGTFPNDVNVNDFDSIISLLPCEATLPIIKESYIYNKPYLFVLCKCTHFTNPWDLMTVSYDRWENIVLNHAYKYKNEKDVIIEDTFTRENGDELLLLCKK